jgi:hypothetical protein
LHFTAGSGVSERAGCKKLVARPERLLSQSDCGWGEETKNEWNTMSMIHKTTDFYNTIYFLKN